MTRLCFECCTAATTRVRGDDRVQQRCWPIVLRGAGARRATYARPELASPNGWGLIGQVRGSPPARGRRQKHYVRYQHPWPVARSLHRYLSARRTHGCPTPLASSRPLPAPRLGQLPPDPPVERGVLAPPLLVEREGRALDRVEDVAEEEVGDVGARLAPRRPGRRRSDARRRCRCPRPRRCPRRCCRRAAPRRSPAPRSL